MSGGSTVFPTEMGVNAERLNFRVFQCFLKSVVCVCVVVGVVLSVAVIAQARSHMEN